MAVLNTGSVVRTGYNAPIAAATNRSLNTPVVMSSAKPGIGFLGGLGPAYAKVVDGPSPVPAPFAKVEVWTEGRKVAETTAAADGQWRINNLDETKIYDVVGRYDVYDAVISRDREAKLLPLSHLAISDGTRSGQKFWRIAVKNFSTRLSVNHNGNPITSTVDQITGIIEFFVGFDSTTYTATITDDTGRTYDYPVVAPSP